MVADSMRVGVAFQNNLFFTYPLTLGYLVRDLSLSLFFVSGDPLVILSLVQSLTAACDEQER